MIATILTTIAGVVITGWVLKKRIKRLQEELKKTTSALRSSFVKHGQSFEQHIPFAKNFMDKANFKFLGQPIDGIAFRDDKIILYEFKTGSSQLNANQKKIKKQIAENMVEFVELRY